MTLITQIEDKGAVVAWSPIGEYADVIALGSKVCANNFLTWKIFIYFLLHTHVIANCVYVKRLPHLSSAPPTIPSQHPYIFINIYII